MLKNKTTNFTKQEIYKKINSKIGISNSYIAVVTDDLIDIIKNSIRIQKINIKNFGTFKIIFKHERLGRNPKTKKTYKIKSAKSLSFIAAKKLNDKIKEV